MMLLPVAPVIFTVSHLNQAVKQLLEMEMKQIWLNAEISNFSQPASGHWYFTLKDYRAQVRCVMFRVHNQHTTFRPCNGQQVLVHASVTLYEPRGDYQLVIESMQPAGNGLLQQQFEQLKQRLLSEGLFAQCHKKSLPRPAHRVGIITSTSGAALQDILQILLRRSPALPVVIYPTAVQGAEAPAQIIKAIEIANQRQDCDVLILGRGGGSLEDLFSFNDEQVARAIFNSVIPIISAVGHETDVTIADFVADLRAPTPSAAAELVSRDQMELLRQYQSQQQRLEMAMDYFLIQRNQQSSQLHHRLQQQHPCLQLALWQNRLLKQQRRLAEGMQNRLNKETRYVEHLQQRLAYRQPEAAIHHCYQRAQQQESRLKWALERQLNRYQQHIDILHARLSAVNPFTTLARGYSVTQASDGQLVKSIRQVSSGDIIKTRLQDGWLESKIAVITAKKNTG